MDVGTSFLKISNYRVFFLFQPEQEKLIELKSNVLSISKKKRNFDDRIFRSIRFLWNVIIFMDVVVPYASDRFKINRDEITGFFGSSSLAQYLPIFNRVSLCRAQEMEVLYRVLFTGFLKKKKKKKKKKETRNKS